MHYIRFLRPAIIIPTPGRRGELVASLLFTITTDLGDSFLYPEDGSIDLVVVAENIVVAAAQTSQVTTTQPPQQQKQRRICRCTWKAGMRVLEAKLPLWPGSKRETVNCRIAVHPAQQQQWPCSTSSSSSSPPRLGTLPVGCVLPWRIGMDENLRAGVIMPATIEFINGVCAQVSLRALELGGPFDGVRKDGDEEYDDTAKTVLEFEEDIGESIARHVWDAGVVTSAYLADVCSSPETAQVLFPIEHDSFNVLELGSGVGILGITIASILPRLAAAQGKVLRSAKVLLTDLDEAEERARSNIARWEGLRTDKAALTPDDTAGQRVIVGYENLDWDQASLGLLENDAASVPWDLVVLSDCTYNVDSLPALVATLCALHTSKLTLQRKGQGKHSDVNHADRTVTLSVLLATKPRHSSEEALFELLKEQSWMYSVLKEIPLPKIGEEDEVVQIYLLEKTEPI